MEKKKGISFGTVKAVVGDVVNAAAKEKLESVVAAKNGGLNKAAEDAVAGLESLAEVKKSIIPEGYFKSNFAKPFQEMIDKNEANEEVVIDWLKISGGGHRKVDLTNDKGELVDTVPPIFNHTPPLSAEDNSKAKEMTQAILLTGEDGGSFHPLLDTENEKLEYLSAIGQKLGAGILQDEDNAKNSKEFKRVVSKYSGKTASEEKKEEEDKVILKTEELEFEID